MSINEALVDFWEHGLSPPWMLRLSDMGDAEAARHLLEHGFTVSPVTPEIAELLVELHDEWHWEAAERADHQHIGRSTR